MAKTMTVHVQPPEEKNLKIAWEVMRCFAVDEREAWPPHSGFTQSRLAQHDIEWLEKLKQACAEAGKSLEGYGGVRKSILWSMFDMAGTWGSVESYKEGLGAIIKAAPKLEKLEWSARCDAISVLVSEGRQKFEELAAK